MEKDWRRLGRALAAAREALDLTQSDIAREIGVSLNPVQTIERGTSKRVTTTMRAYAQRVGWTPDSVSAVLGGGDPELREGDERREKRAHDAADRLAALPARVVQALADDGQLIDATVMSLRRPGGGKAIIVVKGEPDASPEEIARDLEAWALKELELRGIEVPPESPGSASATGS